MNVGCRALPVTDPRLGTPLPVYLLYPTEASARAVAFGPYSLELAMDAEPAPGRWPLVALSHGNGGTPWAYRGLAVELVRAGHAVVVLEHLGNSRSDNSLADTDENLLNRSRQLCAALDAALARPEVAPERAAVLGHSLGGFTAAAVAGGNAMTLPREVIAAHRTPTGELALPADELARLAYPLPTQRHRAVGALILLAPGLGYFQATGALAELRGPILVRTAEHDPICPTGGVRLALRSLAAGVHLDLAEVAGAGHFSFQSPFPPALCRPDFPPANDPPGFDRAAYQRTLAAELVAFLRATRDA